MASTSLEFVETRGDLFSCPATDALVHCISEDIRMGKGIAVLFKNKFGGIDELKKQGKKPGQTAVLKRGARYVYYLITKVKYSDKPTYNTLTCSLEDMKKHCMDNNVVSVCMPLIGCGLDGLKWGVVRDIIKDVFADVNMKITVYSL